MPRVDGVTYGAPCWMDLSSSDLDKAKSFYSELFGWAATDTGADFGHYHIVSKNGADLAGMAGKMPGMESMPDAWTIYLAVEDIAATAERITASGGQVMFEPMVIGDQGSMAIAVDPSGAAFGLWQPAMRKGFELHGEHGAPAWFELMTRDFGAASAFYASVFGVELADMEGGGESPAYKTINVNGSMHAGIMDAAQGMLPEGVPSNWIVYYGVDDTDAAVAKAQELGGSVLVPGAETAWGKWAVLADPMGADFAIIGVG